MKDKFDKLDIDIQTLHMSAIDFKVIALTGLLIDKGLITTREVEEYKEIVLQAVREKNTLEYSLKQAEIMDSCFRYFLRVDK